MEAVIFLGCPNFPQDVLNQVAQLQSKVLHFGVSDACLIDLRWEIEAFEGGLATYNNLSGTVNRE